MSSNNYSWQSGQGYGCPGITHEIKTPDTIKDIWTLRPVPSTEFRPGSRCASHFAWGAIFAKKCKEAQKHILKPTKSWTKWGTQSSAKSGTQGCKLSGRRILKSYRAKYVLKVEDPEIIPGNILSQDRGSWDHTRQYTFSGYRILKSDQVIYLLWIKDPEIITGNVLTLD